MTILALATTFMAGFVFGVMFVWHTRFEAGRRQGYNEARE